MWKIEREFKPKMDEAEREKLYKVWKAAVERSLGWARILKEAGIE
jgi:glycerol kinase